MKKEKLLKVQSSVVKKLKANFVKPFHASLGDVNVYSDGCILYATLLDLDVEPLTEYIDATRMIEPAIFPKNYIGKGIDVGRLLFMLEPLKAYKSDKIILDLDGDYICLNIDYVQNMIKFLGLNANSYIQIKVATERIFSNNIKQPIVMACNESVCTIFPINTHNIDTKYQTQMEVINNYYDSIHKLAV